MSPAGATPLSDGKECVTLPEPWASSGARLAQEHHSPNRITPDPLLGSASRTLFEDPSQEDSSQGALMPCVISLLALSSANTLPASLRQI
ncbi:hypothetical protein E2C01_040486 [Portunus trituberculatus]|uniref:Uncharacterized protein n=1 Tax=Portunus trituberculatus TaxID=210409 RepID=A0A5B7FGT6_PORTR|nr:hypothetical protein [Portunus trituberculatus]